MKVRWSISTQLREIFLEARVRFPSWKYHIQNPYDQWFASDKNRTIGVSKQLFPESVFDKDHQARTLLSRLLVQAEQRPDLLMTRLLSKFSFPDKTFLNHLMDTASTAILRLLVPIRVTVYGCKANGSYLFKTSILFLTSMAQWRIMKLQKGYKKERCAH